MNDVITMPADRDKTVRHIELYTKPEYLKVDIQETCKNYSTIKYWAYILHDKDDTDPHYHIYLNFDKSSVKISQACAWFGLPFNMANTIKGRKDDMLLYLIHGNDSSRHKYQYDPSEVHANFDFTSAVANAQILGDFTRFSYAQQLDYVYKLPRQERIKAFDQLTKQWKLHCQHESLKTDRSIDVIFITGKGGTGKTTYAKKLLDSLGFDYCISSSSNDPMQDYLGQKALILDDCRDRGFKNFEDFLKLLDNHTSSSVQSRYNNKVFNGEVIVITSSVPLHYWYKGKNADGKYFSVAAEDFKQLYRRITCYVEVTFDEISVYNQVGDDGKPKGLATVMKNNLKQYFQESKARRDYGAIFQSFCAPAEVHPFQMSIEEVM